MELTPPQEPQLPDSLQKTSLVASSVIPAVVLALISFTVYFTALSGAFVYDDEIQVVNNPWLSKISNIPTVFSKSVWSFQSAAIISNYYRPLMHCVYIFTYQLVGLNPLGFHLVNLLFHCATTALVFLMVRRLLPERKVTPAYLSAPFIAAIVFASHPIHTEAVTWIAGLPDVAFTFFYLLSFYLYAKSKTLVSSSYLCSLAYFALAAFFKEPALTLPVILFAYDCTCREERLSVPDYAKRCIPYLAIGAGYLALRVHALGGFAPQKRHAFLSSYEYVINVFPLIFQYLRKLVLPIDLNAFYVFHPVTSLLEWKALLSLSVTAVVAILALIALKKSKVAFLGILFVAVPLLPVLYIPALGENTFAERYLYLPSVGYVLLLAVSLSWTEKKIPGAAMGMAVAFLALAGTYAVGTVSRNKVWQNSYALWMDTIEKSPDSALVHNNLGRVFRNRNMPGKAIEQFQAAIKLRPDFDEAHNNLGGVYGDLKLYDMAVGEFEIAAALNPNNESAHFNLGLLYYDLGKMENARREFTKVLATKPDDQETQQLLREISP